MVYYCPILVAHAKVNLPKIILVLPLFLELPTREIHVLLLSWVCVFIFNSTFIAVIRHENHKSQNIKLTKKDLKYFENSVSNLDNFLTKFSFFLYLLHLIYTLLKYTTLCSGDSWPQNGAIVSITANVTHQNESFPNSPADTSNSCPHGVSDPICWY